MPPPLDLLPALLPGLSVTLAVTAGGALVALVMAFAGGLGRLSALGPIRWTAGVYVEVFRGTSALVQLFWVFFVLPLFGVAVTPLTAGILVLGLNIGAYGSEVVRGAIQAVPPQQREAALALGLTPAQTLWRIVIPQAVPAMMPPATNLLVELLKGTALVSLITLGDLTFSAQALRAETLRTPEIFSLVLVLYFAVALVLSLGMRRLERQLSHWRDGQAAA